MGADRRGATPTYEVAVTRRVEASAERVYAVFADYREAHPAILPPHFFTGLTIEQGGYGEGTKIGVTTKFAGRTRTLHGVVTEREPGRRLVETYPADRMVTSFVVDPRPGEQACDVTISTAMPRRPGPLGWLERRFVRRLLTRVYAEELDLLSAYLRRNA